jgi:hypothetical protein
LLFAETDTIAGVSWRIGQQSAKGEACGVAAIAGRVSE